MLQKLKEKAGAPKGVAVENLQSLWGNLELKKQENGPSQKKLSQAEKRPEDTSVQTTLAQQQGQAEAS